LFALFALLRLPASAAALMVQTNVLGPTPAILGCNSGHFFPGSNTRDWWRYVGVNGARVFISPSEIEPSDDIAPVGDGVTSAATFLARRAAMRTNQFNPAYINWGSFSNRYETDDLYPNNHILPSYALAELRKLGIRICAQITASQSRLPIAATNDWPNMWELWQHYYAQAFYLGRAFDVDRYQMYNEPNHPNANGLTITNHLLRLQLASDAIQLAIADVNLLYGKTLSPKILAPVSSGSADSAYPDWGASVVTNRHLNFLGQSDTNFSLIHVYDYHQYGSSPSGFGTDLSNLNGFLTTAMSPDPRFPTAISEFNTRTGATFDTMTETLDTPTEYSRFGSICVNLLANGCSELYCFKFSQTEYTGNYPVQKNALHYVDNNNSPYQVGGITRGGEVWRLFNQAFGPGRDRLNVVKDTGAASLDVSASYDPITRRYCVFSVNNTAAGVALDINLSALGLAASNKVLIEVVSEAAYGSGAIWTNLPAANTISGTQPANTVWLLSVSGNTAQNELVVTATDDAEVRDGTNRLTNYGSLTAMTVHNDPADTAKRSVAFMKFQLPTNDLAKLDFALLSLSAASASVNAAAQAHVYGLTNNNWSQGTITWSNASNLRSNVTAGVTIANGFVAGQGTNAFIVGQLVASSTNAGEKLIDVTSWLRSQTGTNVAFMVSQDPRWDVTLPSLAPGDTQPDGVKILSSESGNGPRLRLVFGQASTSAPPAQAWTNVAESAEAFIRGGASAAVDQDEVATGYLLVKYNPSPFDLSRKAWFQFDLTGLNVNLNSQAVFTVVTHTQTFQHRAQLWGLNQGYLGFNANVTWNNAQANDSASNDLLTNGPATATILGSSILIPNTASAAYNFTIPRLGDFVFSNRVTLVLAGVNDAANDAGGLRLARTNALLQVLTSTTSLPATNSITGITANGNGSFTIHFLGTPNQTFIVQAATNLLSTNWVNLSTNVAGTNGVWTFTDTQATNQRTRFYRTALP
jgi:hypothetical protein